MNKSTFENRILFVHKKEWLVIIMQNLLSLSISVFSTDLLLLLLQRADDEIKKLGLTFQDIGDRSFEDSSDYVFIDGMLYKKNRFPGRQHRLVVPSALRQALIHEYHDLLPADTQVNRRLWLGCNSGTIGLIWRIQCVMTFDLVHFVNCTSHAMVSNQESCSL